MFVFTPLKKGGGVGYVTQTVHSAGAENTEEEQINGEAQTD